MADSESSRILTFSQSRIELLREEAIAYLKEVKTPKSGKEMVQALDKISLLITCLDNFPFPEYRVK